MLAFVAGFILVAYLLAPGAIYRLAFSWFLSSKRFQRTRTEEIVFSACAVILPFLFTCSLLFSTPLGRFPLISDGPSKDTAYQQVEDTLLSNPMASPIGSAAKPPAKNSIDLRAAYKRVSLEQARFVSLLWILCFMEGLLSGYTVVSYGTFREHSVRKWICDRLLLNHVSEWQMLFTTISLPKIDREKTVELDVLCSGVLYRGRLANWFVDTDGNLEGIFIDRASRFQKEEWDRDEAEGNEGLRANYWRKIPGAKMYLAASSITNYNIRYVNPTDSSAVLASEILETADIAELSKTLGTTFTVKSVPKSSDE